MAAALPSGAKHLVIGCKDYEDWAQRRATDAMGHELVAFVDDDDTVHPDAFNLCLRAIEETGLAAACTDELEVDLNGRVLAKSTGEKSYFTASLHPRVVHHVCVMRGDLIDPRVTEFHKRFGVGIDWFIRSSVVMTGGCAHVPMFGHNWTQHPGQHTSSTRILYAKHMREMTNLIRSTWPARFSGKFPVLKL